MASGEVGLQMAGLAAGDPAEFCFLCVRKGMFDAIRQGLGRAVAAPGLLLLLWLVNLLIALPAAILIEESIHDSLKWSRARELLREGFDTGWYGEFKQRMEERIYLRTADQPCHIRYGHSRRQ